MLELVRVNKMDPATSARSCCAATAISASYGVKNPIEVYIACWEWGKYLGEEALAEGVDVCVSSWNRMAPNTLPALAKAGANYMNSQLIRMEADANGYSEGIALDMNGLRQRRFGREHLRGARRQDHTPPLGAGVCPASRATPCSRWRANLDIPVVETIIPREMLYIADEVFFTARPPRSRRSARSTASRSAAAAAVPSPSRSSSDSFEIVKGKDKADEFGWLTPVPQVPSPEYVRPEPVGA